MTGSVAKSRNPDAWFLPVRGVHCGTSPSTVYTVVLTGPTPALVTVVEPGPVVNSRQRLVSSSGLVFSDV